MLGWWRRRILGERTAAATANTRLRPELASAIVLRSSGEIDRLVEVGSRLTASLGAAAEAIRPGDTPVQVMADLADRISSAGLEPARPWPALPWVGSVSINEVRGRGLPGVGALRSGDVVTLDAAARARVDAGSPPWPGAALYVDAAFPIVVPGNGDDSVEADRAGRLVQAAINVTASAVGAMGVGVRWGRVLEAVASTAEAWGVRVVPGWFGHGIGPLLHAAPALGFTIEDALGAAVRMHNSAGWGAGQLSPAGAGGHGAREFGRSSGEDRGHAALAPEEFYPLLPGDRLWPGMVLAIEPVVAWPDSPAAAAGSNRAGSAYAECTVAITRAGPVRLAGPGAAPGGPRADGIGRRG